MATKTTKTTTSNKTICPVTRQQFRDHGGKATPVVTIAGQGMVVSPKEFNQQPGATGASVGYYGNGKVQLLVDGVPTMCQVGLTITVIGSKELPALPTVVSPEVQAIRDAAKARELAAEVAAVA